MALNMKCSRLRTVASKNVFNNCMNWQKCGAVEGPYFEGSSIEGLQKLSQDTTQVSYFCIKRILQYWTFVYNHNS
jgi:hypothetical protein